MAKNKAGLEKDKKKKFPFNVFSKKGLASLAMAGVMIASPFMLAGCSNGQDGKDGKDGANGPAWHYGVDYTEYNGTINIGDFFIDTNDYILYQKTNDGWDTVMENYGRPGNPGNPGNPGDPGEPGAPGTPGQDGKSVYIGYDGYIWNGFERTEFQATNVTIGEDVVENTIGIQGVMSKYYPGTFIDLKENTIALMANYMPTIKATQYSGTYVQEIKVIAKESGILHIGTAKVSDIVNARLTGDEYNATTTEYEVVEGLNTISTEIRVAEDETIVLGGDNSVSVYITEGLPVNDEHGNFTLVNGEIKCFSYIDILTPANVVYYSIDWYTSSIENVPYFVDDCDGTLVNVIPPTPYRKGYTFTGWYKEEQCINKWDFEKDIIPAKEYDEEGNYINKETKIYAGWEKSE